MPRRRNGGLTVKERAFVAYYVADREPGASVVKAGYNVKDMDVASARASELLVRPEIVEAIDKAELALRRRQEMKVDDIIKELSLIARSDVSKIIDFDAIGLGYIPQDQRRAIRSIKVKFFPPDKNATPRAPGEPIPPPWQNRAVESIDVQMWNKVEALAKIGQYFGMFDKELTIERLFEILGPLGSQIRAILASLPAPMTIDQQLPLSQQTLPNGAQLNVVQENGDGQSETTD